MSILSVDLAYKTYRDIGAVVMTRDVKEVTVELLPIPLDGDPSPSRLAAFLADYCYKREIQLLLLDGPQAWKAGHNGLLHSRLCERELNTPAKTGLPGSVKPANYRPFVEFSIAVFDALASLTWRRLSASHAPFAGFTTVESFPLSAWRVLGLKGLSAKNKATLVHIDGCRQELARLMPLRFSGIPSHDELQATVAGLAGLALEAGDWKNCAIAGVAPSFVDGFWREGFIVNATPAFCRASVWDNEGPSIDRQDSIGDHHVLKIQ